MPRGKGFASRSQLRTCYGKQDERWNCDSNLDETPSVCCLAEKSDQPMKCRSMRKGERVVGPVITGSRGGRYFIITEGDCEIKIYLPKNMKDEDILYPSPSPKGRSRRSPRRSS